MELTAEQRTLQAQHAAYTRWSRTPDRAAALAPARRGRMARYERQVDPLGTLSPYVRATLAQAALRADMARLSLQASLARSAKKNAKGKPEMATVCSWCHPRVANKSHEFCDRHAAAFAAQVRARHAGEVA